MENLYAKDSIRTFTGLYMNVFEPTLEMICIEDMAHALSNQCRFGGHLPEFYSVAQHSVLCSEMVPDEHKLATLLHDGAETWLLDIPRPIKKRLRNYRQIEENLMILVAEKFGFKYPLEKAIKEADEEMLKFEWERIMLQNPIPLNIPTVPLFNCWNQKYAKERFSEAYKAITSR